MKEIIGMTKDKQRKNGKLTMGCPLLLTALTTVTEKNGCFIAGTLVHTKQGLKPIEQIQVGDEVLAKPESGEGEQAYKRVLKTLAFDDKPVVLVKYVLKTKLEEAEQNKQTISRDDFYNFVVTPNHPFWVQGLGWTRADALATFNEFELADGNSAVVMGGGGAYQLCKTAENKSDVAWIDSRSGAFTGWFATIKNGQACIALELADDNPDIEWWEEENYFTQKVYNFEVEDFHTYYVGELGVWVHNTDCAKLLEEARGSIISTEAQ